MGLWQKIRSAFVREDEPGVGRDDETDVSSVQYGRPDPGDEGAADESADSQREGEGFR